MGDNTDQKMSRGNAAIDSESGRSAADVAGWMLRISSTPSLNLLLLL
jgi:hypothetical protein